MPLRKRLSLVAAAAVGIAIVLVAIVSYVVVRGELRGQVDDALRAQLVAAQSGFHTIDQAPPGIPASAGGPAQYVQYVDASGHPSHRLGDITLPINAQALKIASTGTGTYMGDIHVGDNHLRELMFPALLGLPNGQELMVAVQLARPLNQVDHVLSELRLILALLGLGGIALAGALGRIASRRVLAPLAEVAQTAEQIGETDDLSLRLKIHADDEVGQLATRFNAMLDRLEASRSALDESVSAQRQLVADASHELRTPITSLRTNIEVLLAGAKLDEEDRRRLLSDVVEQSEELTALVGDLIDLARGDLPPGSTDDVRLDRIAEESVSRSRRNSPGVRFSTALEPVIVEGVPERLERAINNLLDNAARHSPPGGTSRSSSTTTACAFATMEPASTNRIFHTSSIASSAARTRAASRARDSASRSCARSPSSTAVRSARTMLLTAARSSRSGCRRRRVRLTGPVGGRLTRAHRRHGRRTQTLGARRGPRDPGPTRRQEALAQEPEQDREDRCRDQHQQRRSVAAAADHANQADPDRDRRHRCQQGRVRAVAGEVLARGHLEDAGGADHEPDDKRRGAAADQPHDDCDEAREDRDLRDRDAAERTRRPLAFGPELALAAPRLLRGGRLALGALLAAR